MSDGMTAAVKSMLSTHKSFGIVVLLLVSIGKSPVVAQAAQPPSRQSARKISPRGKQVFSSSCAACHGLDGRGTERAPNLAENPKIQRMADDQIVRIIENGIIGTGMPAFHSLPPADVQAVVAHLRTLQGKHISATLPGDPKKGESIFFGKAGCSNCHMISGQGGFIAGDLSAYARNHSAMETRAAITNPAANGGRSRMVTVSTRAGTKYTGKIRNEDNFSLQLQTLEGTFVFLDKSDLEKVEDTSQGTMPSNFGAILSSSELDDLVSYVTSVANATAGGAFAEAHKGEED